MDEPDKTFPPSVSRLSKTPSWVTLGFVLGALFVWALPQAEKTAAPAASRNLTLQLLRPKMTDIEAVFAEWSRYAVWNDDDITEIALWDVDRKSYSIYYEVYRFQDKFYFRSISRLTYPILTQGLPSKPMPLRFTDSLALKTLPARDPDLGSHRP